MTSPVLVVFPGASLMNITTRDDGLLIECPGCHATLLVRTDALGEQAFTHGPRCPVHARIEQASQRYERDVVRRG